MFMIDLGVQSHYSVLGLTPDASAKEIRASVMKIVTDLKRQSMRSPEQKRSFEDRVKYFNSIATEMENPEKRAKYDKLNAHLTFFQVRKAVTPVWDERDLLFRWLHQTVRDFLLAQGEAVSPITDLERTDFTGDVTGNELLDSLLQAGADGRRQSE
jgi:curved DNA-binding protein CbpA